MKTAAKDCGAKLPARVAAREATTPNKSTIRRNSLFQQATFGKFLRDKAYFVALALGTWLIVVLFMIALKVSLETIIVLSVLGGSFIVITLIIEYLRRRKFYHDVLQNLAELDQAYLVLETVERPNFYDGKLTFDMLYEINKSMAENVKKYQIQAQEFQEYVEMWIHEVKTPLATLSLLSHDAKIDEQLKRLDDYVEQILYFARAENAERDYLISKVSLAKVIGEVANRNRAMLQKRGIDFVVKDVDYDVRTDGKWLEFILNQIINNSIKYQSKTIKIYAERQRGVITLTIRDDGIGISEKDLPRVFDKSFTGSNGRTNQKSTGMGLYIAKVLCTKLGHQINVQSEQNQYTAIQITFSDNHYYDVTN